MIAGMFDSGAIPVLQRLVNFTGRRQRVLADSVANLSTPNYEPRDLDVEAFQAQLREAIDTRRDSRRGTFGPLPLRERDPRYRSAYEPTERREGILYHDRNNRDLERIMQDVAENALAHNAGVQMLKNEYDMLRTAIRERI